MDFNRDPSAYQSSIRFSLVASSCMWRLEKVQQIILHLCFFFLCFLFVSWAEISSCAPIPIFIRSRSVHSGSTSWNDCWQAFPTSCEGAHFPDKVSTQCLDSTVNPIWPDLTLRLKWLMKCEGQKMPRWVHLFLEPVIVQHFLSVILVQLGHGFLQRDQASPCKTKQS